jgi:hypothetical protein
LKPEGVRLFLPDFPSDLGGILAPAGLRILFLLVCTMLGSLIPASTVAGVASPPSGVIAFCPPT